MQRHSSERDSCHGLLVSVLSWGKALALPRLKTCATSGAALSLLLVGGCDGPRHIEVSEGGGGAYEASLARFGDGWAVAWHDTRDGHPEIYARLLDIDGEPTGPPRRLTDTANFSYEPQLAAVGGSELVVAWYAVSPSGTSATHVAAWDLAGDAGPLWTRTLSNPVRLGQNVIVRVEARRLFCAWIEKGDAAGDDAVWAQWFDLDLAGRPLSPAHRLADAGPTTWNVNAAIDGGGRAWVVFDATAGTRTDELFLVVADAGDAAAPLVRLTDDDGIASKYPDLAFGSDTAAVTWFDERDGNQEVYLAVAPLPQLRDRFEVYARRVTATEGASIGAYLAWNSGRVGLAWSDDTGGQSEVYFQVFDAAGAAADAAERLTNNPTASLIPAIHPRGDGFALAWNEDVVEERGDHRSGGRSDIVFATVH